MVGLLGCERTFQAHVELLIHQYPQVLLLRAALEPLSAQPVLVFGIAPTHVQDLVLGLAELHAVHTGPPLQPVKVPLNGIPSLQSVNHTTQLGVIGKLAEGALGPTVHVTNKDIEQHQPQYRPLRHTTRHWSPPGHQAIDCNSLSASIEPVPYPTSGPAVKSMSFQLRDKDIMWDSVECLAQGCGIVHEAWPPVFWGPYWQDVPWEPVSGCECQQESLFHQWEGSLVSTSSFVHRSWGNQLLIPTTNETRVLASARSAGEHLAALGMLISPVPSPRRRVLSQLG